MIAALDRGLMKHIRKNAPRDSLLVRAVVSNEPPTLDWQGALAKNTINCFLFGCGENTEARTEEPVRVSRIDGEGRRRTERLPAPVHFDCLYRITAWSPAEGAARIAEEHQLLSQVIEVLYRHPRIDPALFSNTALEHQPRPYPKLQPLPAMPRDDSDFWTALGQQPRPSLTLRVTLAWVLAPLPVDDNLVTKPVVERIIVTEPEEP